MKYIIEEQKENGFVVKNYKYHGKLKGAKRDATRERSFHNTVLIIMNQDGITLSEKIRDAKWTDYNTK